MVVGSIFDQSSTIEIQQKCVSAQLYRSSTEEHQTASIVNALDKCDCYIRHGIEATNPFCLPSRDFSVKSPVLQEHD